MTYFKLSQIKDSMFLEKTLREINFELNSRKRSDSIFDPIYSDRVESHRVIRTRMSIPKRIDIRRRTHPWHENMETFAKKNGSGFLKIKGGTRDSIPDTDLSFRVDEKEKYEHKIETVEETYKKIVIETDLAYRNRL